MDKPEFFDEIGRTVVALARRIPRGVLVFLPSYSVIRRIGRAWRASEVSRVVCVVACSRRSGQQSVPSCLRRAYLVRTNVLLPSR